MDNASKALIIAGSVLISILVISLSMYLVNAIKMYSESESSQRDASQAEAFNRFFIYSQGYSEGSGGKTRLYDAYNIVSKIVDVNQEEGSDVIALNYKGTNYTKNADIMNVAKQISGELHPTNWDSFSISRRNELFISIWRYRKNK